MSKPWDTPRFKSSAFFFPVVFHFWLVYTSSVSVSDNSVGEVEVDGYTVPSNESLLKANPDVTSGGEWRPQACVARYHVAVIIAYRNRPKHLPVLLKYLHPMLQHQHIHYRIFVIEQVRFWCTSSHRPWKQIQKLNILLVPRDDTPPIKEWHS